MVINKDSLISIGISIVVFGLIIAILVYVIASIDPIEMEENQRITNEKCCGGQYCTDVYYDNHDNKCHSTFYLQEVLNGNESIWKLIVPISIIAFTLLFLFWYFKTIRFEGGEDVP